MVLRRGKRDSRSPANRNRCSLDTSSAAVFSAKSSSKRFVSTETWARESVSIPSNFMFARAISDSSWNFRSSKIRSFSLAAVVIS